MTDRRSDAAMFAPSVNVAERRRGFSDPALSSTRASEPGWYEHGRLRLALL